MTTLDSELLESVEKDYFDDPRVMALVDRFRCAQSEPAGVITSMVKGGVTWHIWPDQMADGTKLYATAQPAQPFSREAISATQAAWKMGYDAGKEEKATQPSTLPPLPKNLHSLAGMIWPRIMDWYDAEAGEEAELAAQKIQQAIEEQMQAYAREALRLNGVNV